MHGWNWADPRWRDDVGSDVAATVREALRRGVDLRDTLAQEERDETSRAVFLVDVLNHLAQLQGVDTGALWDAT